MAWDPELTSLRDLLADLYPTVNNAKRVVAFAGLPSAHIAFSDKSINNWHNILTEAQARNMVDAIIEVARKDYPENEGLALAERGNLRAGQGLVIGDDRS